MSSIGDCLASKTVSVSLPAFVRMTENGASGRFRFRICNNLEIFANKTDSPANL